MTGDDIDTQRARAARLREQIKKLKSGPPSEGSADPDVDPKTPAPSPREFIHERMKDLDGKRRK